MYSYPMVEALPLATNGDCVRSFYGTTLLPGFEKQLVAELQSVFKPSNLEKSISITPHGSLETQKYASWRGLSKKVMEYEDQTFWLSKEEYDEGKQLFICYFFFSLF